MSKRKKIMLIVITSIVLITLSVLIIGKLVYKPAEQGSDVKAGNSKVDTSANTAAEQTGNTSTATPNVIGEATATPEATRKPDNEITYSKGDGVDNNNTTLTGAFNTVYRELPSFKAINPDVSALLVFNDLPSAVSKGCVVSIPVMNSEKYKNTDIFGAKGDNSAFIEQENSPTVITSEVKDFNNITYSSVINTYSSVLNKYAKAELRFSDHTDYYKFIVNVRLDDSFPLQKKDIPTLLSENGIQNQYDSYLVFNVKYNGVWYALIGGRLS